MMAELTKETVQVYRILFNMGMQLLLTIVGIIAFFLTLFKLFDAQTVFDSTKYGLIEFLLGGTLFVCYKHFFPTVFSKAEPVVLEATSE